MLALSLLLTLIGVCLSIGLGLIVYLIIVTRKPQPLSLPPPPPPPELATPKFKPPTSKTVKSGLTKKTTSLIAVAALLTILLGAGLTVFYYGNASYYANQVNQDTPILNTLNETMAQVQSSTPVTTLDVTYTSSYPIFDVSNDAINYTFGNVQVSDLSLPYSPSTLIISAYVTSVAHVGTAKITYSGNYQVPTLNSKPTPSPTPTPTPNNNSLAIPTPAPLIPTGIPTYARLPQQEITIGLGINTVDVPIGIDQIDITNATQGETITFNLKVNVEAIWNAMNMVVATGTTTGTAVLQVTSGGETAPPVRISAITANTTTAGANFELTTTALSTYPLQQFYYEWNNTGFNVDTVPLAVNGENLTFTGQWTATSGTVAVTLHVEDAFGNWHVTPVYTFNIVLTAPTPTPTPTPISTPTPTPTVTPTPTPTPTSTPSGGS